MLDLQRRLLAELERRGGESATCEELAEALNVADEVETLFHLLERLAANPGRGVERLPGATPFEARYRRDA